MAPTQRPLTLEQVKKNLRLSETDTTFDLDLYDKIDAATDQVQRDTNSQLITATYQQQWMSFPSDGGPLVLSKRPVQSVESLSYIDADGGTVVMDSSAYVLDKSRRMVWRTGSDPWPQTSQDYGGVILEFKAGYGDTYDFVGRLHRQAMLLQVGKWFEDPVMDMKTTAETDQAYERIIQKILDPFYAVSGI